MKFHQQSVKKTMHPNSPTLMFILFLVFQLLGRTLSCQNSSQSSPRPIPEGSGNENNGNFFYLVQQWQISSCNLRPCQKPAVPTFSIDGFWPSCSSGIPNCKTRTIFDPSKILDLKNELDKEWPCLEEEENEVLWKKEWESHGICSEPILSQHAFFETALKLKQTYDLITILANRAIFPFGEVYGLRNISDAIRDATGYNPQVECKSYKQIPLLSSIFLCFHYTYIAATATAASSIHINIIDCPQITRCNFQAILFPYDLFQLS